MFSLKHSLFSVGLGLTLLSAWSTMAQATQYDANLYGRATGAAYNGFHVGVQQLPWREYLLSAGASGRGLEVGIRRNVSLFTLGTASVALTAGYARGGGQLGLSASGSVGPVALQGSVLGWNTPLSNFDPLERWTLPGQDTRSSGLSSSVQARYRLRRDLILTATGDWNAQHLASLSAQWRREALSYRLGAQVGSSAGLKAGATYRTDNLTLSIDSLLGPQSGFTVQAEAPGVLPLGQNAADLNAYLSYEPWRSNTQSLRYGLGASLPTEQQTWSVWLRGGTGGLGAQLGWKYAPEQ